MTRLLPPLALLATLVAFAHLAATTPEAAVSLAGRLAPIFLFVIGMSVVVNISSRLGVFDTLTRALEDVAPRGVRARRHALWAGLIVMGVVVTVFLSLDTTAILLTPLAVTLARRNGLGVIAVALAVVWISNIASLPLAVSNLTNLLALGSDAFATSTDYLRAALAPGLAAVGVAVAASWLFYVRGTPAPGGKLADARSPAGEARRDRLIPFALVTLGVLLPTLASPIPYWWSSSVAAVVLLGVGFLRRREVLSWGLVPWSSLLLATMFSTFATLVNDVGGAEAVRGALGGAEHSAAGLFLVAGAGLLMSNLINNIPAFLALEPAVETVAGYLALLIGVNAGPLITPWASLATLLWHDQLRRAGVEFSWRTYALYGLVLAPLAVVVPTAVLVLQVS